MRNCISELESLAITPNRLDELNDAYEMENLVEGIKLILYQDYKLDMVFFVKRNNLVS